MRNGATRCIGLCLCRTRNFLSFLVVLRMGDGGGSKSRVTLCEHVGQLSTTTNSFDDKP